MRNYRSKRIALFVLPVALLVSTLLFGCGSKVKETAHGIVVKTVTDKECAARYVRLEVVNDDVIRVSATAGKHFSQRKSLMANYTYPAEKTWTVGESENGYVMLETQSLRALVADDGTVTFTDLDGHPLLSEKERVLTPMTDPQADKQGKHKSAYTLRQLWQSGDDEAYYGLGQHQSDEMNYKDKNEKLFQYNTKVTVPMIVSTKGYGILWDNYSESRWGDARDYARLDEVFTLYDKEGKAGGLTGTYTHPGAETLVRTEPFLALDNEQNNKRYAPQFPMDGATVVYEGEIEAKESGLYKFLLYYAGYTKVFVGEDEVVAERWRTAWNPNSYKFDYTLEAGHRVPLRVEWRPDGGTSYCALSVLSPRPADEENTIAFWSEMGDEIDYYFIGSPTPTLPNREGGPVLEREENELIAGSTPSLRERGMGGEASPLDRVVSGYRAVTGKAPIMPKWAMGFWQCRERYKTADEILSVMAEFRQRGIPVDNIVQDWFYWEEDSWGSHEFDRSRYPDPKAMIDSIHALNGHYMLSVWPKFYHTTEHFKEFDAKGWMYRRAVEDSIRDWVGPGYVGSFYDAYSAEARQLFWNQMNEHLFSRYPIDAWWMDASEPNVRDCQEMPYLKALCGPTDLGSSTEYLMAYGLMNADAIYNGQRSVSPNQRVFLLTRNGYAGLQRYSTAIWSGDIGTRWEDLKAQITAGINFCLSGIPFWGMDSGGFCTEKRYERAWNEYQMTGVESEDLKEWRELQARWFQVDAFVPLFRVHGQYPFREIWNTAPAGHPAYESMVFYDKMRYTLMPYYYSLNGMVHFDDYTLMRGLVMDFGEDVNVRAISDQFMSGPSLMACPITTYGARERDVYFPQHAGGWYDAYTAQHVSEGGDSQSVAAPYERMPLYIPAGAVIPTGPEVQYASEKPLSELTVHVYAGQDGHFTLYEDEGTNYDYEKGLCSFIGMDYDDATHTFTLCARRGSYPEMVAEKTVTVCLHTPEGCQEATIAYIGDAVSHCFEIN